MYTYTGVLKEAMPESLTRTGYTRAEAVEEIAKLFVTSPQGQRFAADLVITDYAIMLRLVDEARHLHAQGRDDLALRVMSGALGLVRGELLDGVKGVDGSPWVTAQRAEIRDCVTAMAADAAEWAQAEGWAAEECEQFAAAMHRLGPSSGPR